MLGKRKGDVIELPMVVPADFERADLRGTESTTRLELQETFRMVPPTDEEIQELFEVKTAEDLARVVRERIAEAKEMRERGRIESALLE
ncbi:MAG: hypothetical protein HC813_03320, partial [Planctomycetes bacterium]|nr:hypothetical protein [Planctomycetota bacterium]